MNTIIFIVLAYFTIGMVTVFTQRKLVAQAAPTPAVAVCVYVVMVLISPVVEVWALSAAIRWRWFKYRIDRRHDRRVRLRNKIERQADDDLRIVREMRDKRDRKRK